MSTSTKPGAPAPRQLSRILDDYRQRLPELADTDTAVSVLGELVFTSPERAAKWLFANTALHHAPLLVRDDRAKPFKGPT